MNACHDPYRELELYLEKAQEEIGKAFEELNCANVPLTEQCSSWNNSFEPLLPPPPAFRSDPVSKKLLSADATPLFATVNRVCYDGNIIDFVRTLPGYPAKSNGEDKKAFPPPLRKAMSSPGTGSFFSRINASLLQQSDSQTAPEEKFDYSPQTKRRLFQLRSSLSFDSNSASLPNPTSHRKNSETTDSQKQLRKLNSSTLGERTGSLDLTARRMRPRSLSDTSPPKSRSSTFEDHSNTFPRPPSGDVNLLSIWADNLVLEIDKSFSGELSDSVGTCSPISECSFCSTKQETNNLEDSSTDAKETVPLKRENKRDTVQDFLCPVTNCARDTSPDSGIGQARIEIPTPAADCVDSGDCPVRRNIHCLSVRSEIDPSFSDNVFDSITPPPPEFDDDPRRFKLVATEPLPKDKHAAAMFVGEDRRTANAETQTEHTRGACKSINKSDCVLAANSVLMHFNDESDTLQESPKSIYRLARVIPVATVELEDSPTVSTTCAIAEERFGKSDHREDKECVHGEIQKNRVDDAYLEACVPSQHLDVLSEDNVKDDCRKHIGNNTTVKDDFRNEDTSSEDTFVDNISPRPSTLPKQVLRVIEAGRLSSSLPRNGGRFPTAAIEPSGAPQRANSVPTVSSLSKVSVDEVAAFMSKVKNSTYYPPPRADVCVDVKNPDCDSTECNKDAVTQTTPILSRSSSFTWITECDCSDWDSSNIRSSSEDSLFLSCSNCTPDKQTATSSSPSPPPATSEEEEERAPRSSLSSSLSLSACSENCSEKDFAVEPNCETVTPETAVSNGKEIPEVAINEDVGATVTNAETHGFSGSYSGGTTLCDTVEGRCLVETVSVNSIEEGQSSSTSSDSTSGDHLNQSSSFPCTLKSSKGSHGFRVAHVAINELHIKSSSAPVLRQKRNAYKRKCEDTSVGSSPDTTKADRGSPKNEGCISSTNNAAKELSELQAVEACSWLRATGFPQYAQMYEDNLFPIEICTVQKDHAFLHPDSIQSLFRRLNTLNRCARMKFMDNIPRKSLHLDESDDEDQCALSENWQFQRTSRRWSRVPSPPEGLSEISSSVQEPPPSPKSYLYPPSSPVRKFLSPEEAYCSSHDSVFIDEQNSSPDSVRRVSVRSDDKYNVISSHRGGGCSPGSSSGSGGTLSLASEETLDTLQRNLRRSGSDRIKEGAKALFRRMESLKGKRKKKNLDLAHSERKHDTSASIPANCGTEGSSSSSMTPSPQLSRRERTRNNSLHDASDCSQGGTPQLKHRKKGWGVLFKGDSSNSAHSDSECPVVFVSERWKDANCNDTKLIEHYVTSQASVTITTNTPNQELCSGSRNQKISVQDSTNSSLLRPKNSWLQENYHHSEENSEKEKRGSYYDNLPAPLAVFNNNCIQDLQKSSQQEIDTSKASDKSHDQPPDEGEIILINTERRDSGVGSSLTRGSSYQQAPWHCFFNHSPSAPMKDYSKGIPITTLSAPQVLVLRKLSLLKLTTLMEKFSPSSRTGWSWGVPKFIRRIRTPDYKDKVVFGVPLLLILQRTGQPLPVSIQAAIHYLRKTALDSTGLFRKSGVRSRIQKLRNLNESTPDKISYEDQQAYDVADMLKQYFRELPEALLTNKLSETFISIHQYIPEELRLEAIQAAILLMPDENREVLQSLLSFLQEVCEHSTENQMTATNLAVCFAPSLFHLSTPRSASASPCRRKTVGVPDLRELNENRAAYECLSTMVVHYKELFTISEEILSQCRLSFMEDCEPATLEELTNTINGGHRGWRIYIDGCIQALLKEVKDKSKGWINLSQSDGIELAYRKVGDGHPLRLWKVSTEVEAPPVELLNRILWERHVWDSSFLKWRVLQRLEKHTEIFQYVSAALPPHPPCDFCVIRSWKTDLPKGTCVLIETSIEHPDALPMIDGVRAVVLASRVLIEPCGSGKSRITHISRVDTRGRSPEWYNRAYGHICTLQMTRLRDSFSHSTKAEGPETKV